MGRGFTKAIRSAEMQGALKQIPPDAAQAMSQTNTLLGNIVKASGVATPVIQPVAPLQFDNPERAGRIEASLGRAAFGPERIREILMQLKGLSFLANGGRVGFQEGGPTSMAAGLQYVGPGIYNGPKIVGMPMPGQRVPTLNISSEGRAVNSITGVPLPLGTETTPLPLSTETTPEPLQFDNPERAERIEASLTRAAFGPERIREILMQLKGLNYLADGGIVSLLKK